MAQTPPELLAHREWLGQIEPVGLVVSPNVLVRQGVVVDRQKSLEIQTKLSELVGDEDEARVANALTFFRDVLAWPEAILAGSPSGSPIPDGLVAALPEYEDHIRPTYALADPDKPEAWSVLILVTSASDVEAKPAEGMAGGWRASAHSRLERLLRETNVATGVLFNATSLRLVYAPRGESSGHLTFKFKYLLETQGRPMAGALAALLGVERVTDVGAPGQRLSLLLKESRKSQSDVSTALAGQVLEALWELVRGFQHANEASKRQLLEHAMREAPNEVYGGLLTTLMRLVFVLYAEDRGLMPGGDVYQRHYSAAGLFQRLREDAARYPDTMDARFGAWAQLLALFRLIHDGGRHGNLRFTARHGRLFDPDAYPFLEGRLHRTLRSRGDRVDPPRVSDGVVFRVLQNLLILDSERLSYRALDVEQIGSVYEAMMGFALEQAHGPSIAVSPKHIVVNINDLLEQKGSERAKWLREQAELKLPSADVLSKAANGDDVVVALGKKASRYTPNILPVNALYLQPTEERRRSGSHYTPRSLTEPIVRTTFRPIFERLGDQATPEQILDLKVCDPAMGSGAFLVEACRLLAERLVKAWEVHKQTPKVPDDEDVLTFAKRLVAERCLYGVDKNIFAVDLAKLSLWLATLAREHPFTFLDHSLRHGDSLVGLSREQIACFNWEVEAQMPLLRSLIDERVREAQRLREQIQGLATSDDVPRKEHLLKDAEDALADVRLIGNLVISAFFEREKPKERKILRIAYGGKMQSWLSAEADAKIETQSDLRGFGVGLLDASHPITPFHWEVEFPEVFTRANGGFDVFVGNPPFMGGMLISTRQSINYLNWLTSSFAETGDRCDLVAYFFRRAFELLRDGATFGFVATNTISQGDTREGGLAWICRNGGQIYKASKRVPWPGAAAVIVSTVEVSKGLDVSGVELDGHPVQRISAFLLPGTQDASPHRLIANAGIAFVGTNVLGMGFTFDDGNPDATSLEKMGEILGRHPEWADLVRPFIGGEEINNEPDHRHHRYVIDFDAMTLQEASRYPDLLRIVEQKVRPSRQASEGSYQSKWWQFGRRNVEGTRSMRGLGRVLVCCQVSPYLSFAFVPPTAVYAHTVNIFASDRDELFAVLQSRIHEAWARTFGSSMKDDLRYTPTDCFETFPLPAALDSSRDVGIAGRNYSGLRSTVMLQRRQGLTKTYGRFHDPNEHDSSIVRLRELHDAMDRAVIAIYGWHDIQLRCGFIPDYEEEHDDQAAQAIRKRRAYRYRWPDEIRDEVLGRLLQLNAARASEERAAIVQPTGTGGRRGTHGHSRRQTPLLE